jgi:plasmid replication initiation protein
MSSVKLPANRNVKKHVAAIHVSNKLSLLERKMSNVLLWNAYEDLLKNETHKIRVKDLAEIIGFDSNDRALLKRSLVNLMQTVLEWNVLDEKGREKDWEACAMLDYARMKGVYCYYSYVSKLREKLYNPEMYERINLTIQRKFSSGYALALYENCLRFKNTGCTGWFSLEVFRKLVGVAPKEYADFRRLNARVIKGPIQQINKSSDILLTPEYKREKRRVVAVRFKIEENPQISLFRTAGIESRNKERERVNALLSGKDALRKRLLLFGLSEEQAEKILSEKGNEFVRENLEVVEQAYQAGKVKNLPAYALAALKSDYRPKKTPVEQEAEEEKKSKKRRIEEEQQEQRRLETLKGEFVANRIQEALQKLGDSERQRFEERFKERYSGDLVYKQFRDMGMDHPVVQCLFIAFARRELLTEDIDKEFTEFINEKDLDQAIEVTA